MSAPTTPARLVRDRLTLTLDGAFVMWGWFLYGFGPAVPLIADEQGISRGQAGLHGTAMAIGAVLAGSVGPTLAVRLGRRLVIALGSLLVAVGIAALMVGGTLAVTLTAVAVIGIGGNAVLSAIQPALVVHHGPAAAAAVTEGNAAGSTVGVLAPLAVGATVAAGWGWRPAVAVTAVLAVVVGALVMRLPATEALGRGTPGRRAAPAPVTDGTTTARAGGFSRTFWLFWAALLCGVAIEFSTTFWAADVVVARTGAGAGVATAAVSALVVGMSLARFVGGPMAVRRPPAAILLVSYGIAVVGFGVLWTATTPAGAVVGLVVTGLGYGAHYPMTVSLVLAAARGRTDQAQALATVGTGVAIAAAPFALGSLADAFGAHRAFLLVLGLLVAGGTAIALGRRAAATEERVGRP